MKKPKPRVGILTLTQSENYGTVLQAYATKCLFESLSSELDFELIPTDVDHVRRRRLLSLGNFRNPNFSATRIHNFRSMRKFIKPHVSQGRRYVNIADRTRSMQRISGRYDALITGSDEVWNLAFVGAKSLYYIPPGLAKFHASYATSANRIDTTSIESEDREILRRSLQGYDYLAVRDTNTVNFVSDITDGKQSATEIIDPTLLNFLPTARRTRGTRGKKRVLLMVRDRVVGEAILNSLAGTANLDSVFIKYDRTNYLTLTPLEFSTRFVEYDCVVTDFFHGTCMSIRTGAPVVCFDSEAIYSNYESKIANVTSKLGLGAQYVNIAALPKQEGATLVVARVEEILGEAVTPADYRSALERERRRATTVASEIVNRMLQAV